MVVAKELSWLLSAKNVIRTIKMSLLCCLYFSESKNIWLLRILRLLLGTMTFDLDCNLIKRVILQIFAIQIFSPVFSNCQNT